MRALLEGAPVTGHEFVAPWMSIAAEARVRALTLKTAEERQRCCEFEAIKISLGNLRSFPWIAQREAAGKLALHGAWFDIHSGGLKLLQPDGSFSTPE